MNCPVIQGQIARGIRKLRRERRLTQVELAKLLGLSQAQLSKIEHGYGSLTAEQLIRLLQKYSLPLSDFIPEKQVAKQEEDPTLQNALVHLGAAHLRVIPDVAVPERLAFPEEVIVVTLVGGSSRLIAALAPVIVRHCEKINFHQISGRLRTYADGIRYRAWWVVDGTYHALGERLKQPCLPRELHRLYQRAFLLLERKKLDVGTVQDQLEGKEDELDRDLISERTVQLVKKNRDKLAGAWHIVTRIKSSDFEQALKESEEP